MNQECKLCGDGYRPSSSHLLCPACRGKARKILCACGKKKNKESLCCIVCFRAKPKSGVHSPSWKGGRSYHKAGYVAVRQHHTRKYRFEHVLVMEKKLRRPLIKGENVHHKNGVKDDNRLCNLELWIKPQPPGIRVEDAVKWAKEILERYNK